MRKGTYIRLIATRKLLTSEIKNNCTLIDLGGYDGSISKQLKNYFSQINITVVDIDKKGLEIAKKHNLKTLYSSVINLHSISSISIDTVLCFDLIEHIEEDKTLISEISRILKKNGKLILTTPMQNGVLFPFLSKIKNEKINKKWGHVRKGYSIFKIKELIQDNGLKFVKNDKYFNYFSKFVYYWLDKFFFIPLRFRKMIFRIVVQLEPYIKSGANEHIIIGRKVGS